MLSLHELPSENKVNFIIIITLNVDCHLQKRNRSSIIWNTFSVDLILKSVNISRLRYLNSRTHLYTVYAMLKRRKLCFIHKIFDFSFKIYSHVAACSKIRKPKWIH